MKSLSKHFQHCGKDVRMSYLEVYDLLTDGRDIKSVLEIGVGEGRSLWLWRSWFPDAAITGIDIIDAAKSLKVPVPENTTLITDDVKNFQTDERWDLIVDDGSHLLAYQLWVLDHLTKNLTESGLLVIEDIQSKENLTQLIKRFGGNKANLHIIDRRFVKGRYDALLLVYKQSRTEAKG